MKKILLSAFAAAMAWFAVPEHAAAATLTYTFNDMTWVGNNHAGDTFNTARYWEYYTAERWGTVWEASWGFTDAFPAGTAHNHFHIGFKGQSDCYAFQAQQMGRFVNGVCEPLPLMTNRGPFMGHLPSQRFYFQVTRQSGTLVPFDLQTMDVYIASNQAVDVYVRTASGAWYWWPGLHGAGPNSEVGSFRWTFSQDIPAKVIATVWKSSSGSGPASVGRISVKD